MEFNASFLTNLGVTLDLKQKKKSGKKEKDKSPDTNEQLKLDLVTI